MESPDILKRLFVTKAKKKKFFKSHECSRCDTLLEGVQRIVTSDYFRPDNFDLRYDRKDFFCEDCYRTLYDRYYRVQEGLTIHEYMKRIGEPTSNIKPGTVFDLQIDTRECCEECHEIVSITMDCPCCGANNQGVGLDGHRYGTDSTEECGICLQGFEPVGNPWKNHQEGICGFTATFKTV